MIAFINIATFVLVDLCFVYLVIYLYKRYFTNNVFIRVSHDSNDQVHRKVYTIFNDSLMNLASPVKLCLSPYKEVLPDLLAEASRHVELRKVEFIHGPLENQLRLLNSVSVDTNELSLKAIMFDDLRPFESVHLVTTSNCPDLRLNLSVQDVNGHDWNTINGGAGKERSFKNRTLLYLLLAPLILLFIVYVNVVLFFSSNGLMAIERSFSAGYSLYLISLAILILYSCFVFAILKKKRKPDISLMYINIDGDYVNKSVLVSDVALLNI